MEQNPTVTEEHGAAAHFLALPEPVLVCILKKLPQHDRLSRAALVSKTWAAAAAAATTVITLSRVTAATAAGLGSWLQQHGRGVVKGIRVPANPDNQVQIKLPGDCLAQLQVLHLHNCALEFSGSSGSSGGGSGNSSSSGQRQGAHIYLPALRSLLLNNCREPIDAVSHLECPKLTALQLFPPVQDRPPAADKQPEQLNAALLDFLQRLPELLFLGLGHGQLTGAALAQLSCLQRLKQCTLCCPQATPEMLPNLSSSLTRLDLMSGRGVLRELDLPAAGWPHLKKLYVSNHVMQPALLSRLTALEHLTLRDCQLDAYPDKIRPATQEYDRGLMISQAKEDVAQLLAALTPLTKLKRLDLTDIYLDTVTAVHPGDFSALTASSVLESLTVAYRSAGGEEDPTQPLPTGAVAALFPPWRQLTSLTELVLDGMDPELVADLEQDPEYDLEYDPFDIATCMGGPELPLLREACPNLQRLTLNSVLPHYNHELNAFLFQAQDRMQALTYLCLGGLCLMDDEAPALANITRLRELELHNAPELGPNGLAHLTSLTQLSRLLLHGVGHRRCLDCLLTSTSKTDQPNVWLQLQLELPGMREQQWAMQQDYDSGEDPYSDGDYSDSSDSDGCMRRGAVCAGYW